MGHRMAVMGHRISHWGMVQIKHPTLLYIHSLHILVTHTVLDNTHYLQ